MRTSNQTKQTNNKDTNIAHQRDAFEVYVCDLFHSRSGRLTFILRHINFMLFSFCVLLKQPRYKLSQKTL